MKVKSISLSTELHDQDNLLRFEKEFITLVDHQVKSYQTKTFLSSVLHSLLTFTDVFDRFFFSGAINCVTPINVNLSLLLPFEK